MCVRESMSPQNKGKNGCGKPLSVQDLLALPENRFCADCRAMQPLWASINIGIFICIRCAGIHRNLGVHYSKVRSLDLDTKCWDLELIEFMRSRGNFRMRAKYEACVPPYFLRPSEHAADSIRENWIRAKYVQLLFVANADRSAQTDVDRVTDDVCTFAMPEDAREGFLSKLADSGQRWKQHWFVLHGPLLSYFKNTSDSFAASSINLINATIDVPEARCSDCERNNQFEIRTDGRVFSIVAPEFSIMLEWVHALRRSSIYYSNLGGSELYQSAPPFEDAPSWAALEAALCRGYLVKQGGKRKSWNRRYFILVGGSNPGLYYFKSLPASDSCKPDGGICLLNAQVMPAEDRTNRNNCFAIITPLRQYFMQSTQAAEYNDWFERIHNIINSSSRRLSVDFKAAPL